VIRSNIVPRIDATRREHVGQIESIAKSVIILAVRLDALVRQIKILWLTYSNTAEKGVSTNLSIFLYHKLIALTNLFILIGNSVRVIEYIGYSSMDASTIGHSI
jgi:hypothetical protein